MTEYNHTLTTTAELKRINLQNMQMAIRLRDLEAENKALKDKLAQLVLAKEITVAPAPVANTLACHFRQAGE